MLTIRLTRIGKKNKPQYRILVQEKSRATASRYIEQVGFYNPHSRENQVELKKERIKYWISKGAKASPTVHNMLVKHSLIQGKAIPLGRPKKKKTEIEEDAKTESTESKVKEQPAVQKTEEASSEPKPKKTTEEKKEEPEEPKEESVKKEEMPVTPEKPPEEPKQEKAESTE